MLLPVLRRPALAMLALAVVLALTSRPVALKPLPVTTDILTPAPDYILGQLGKRMLQTP